MKLLRTDYVWCLFMNDALLAVFLEKPIEDAITEIDLLKKHYGVNSAQAKKVIDKGTHSLPNHPMAILRLETHKALSGR